MRMMDSYADTSVRTSSTAHVGYRLRTSPDWDYLRALRDGWEGPLIRKWVLRPMTPHGFAMRVSMRSGCRTTPERRFDAAPATITALPAIFDSGIAGGIDGGLDILRAIAPGTDFVMPGRARHYALAAPGPTGPAHLIAKLARDMEANIGQLGTRRPQ